MYEWLAVAIGGALGAMLRFGLQKLFVGSLFPWGTFVVNAIGSLLIGLLFVWMVERGLAVDWLRAMMITGLLGALTTFSTFSLDSIRLLQMGEWNMLITNILGQVIVCLLLTWLGIQLARLF
ncbi:MAG: fluoride efflux transporter CrcB [Zetaproteobacteria bacterium]|nr:fluoride efflux transporter CrcB [Zetaproteobacteria bacterium]